MHHNTGLGAGTRQLLRRRKTPEFVVLLSFPSLSALMNDRSFMVTKAQ